MNIREWIADNIGYRFGCFYAKNHDRIFKPIAELIPEEFKNRELTDLACGDGQNTLRLKEIFEAKKVIGFERNPFLVEKASKKGIEVTRGDLTQKIPEGELATFSLAFHHIPNEKKVEVLRKVKDNFDYIFLLEPKNDLYHRLFDAGEALSKEQWIEVFDEALEEYKVYEQGNNLIVFYQS